MNCPPSVFAYNAPCAMGPGGIKAVYVADPDKVRVAVDSSGAVTLSPVAAGEKPFYKWEVAPGASTLQTEAQISEADNVRFFRTTLSAVLNGFKPSSAGTNLLTRLTRLAVIVEMNDGSAVFVGLVGYSNDNLPEPDDSPGYLSRGMEVTGFTWTPGQSKDDAVRATLTGQLDSLFMPNPVSAFSDLVNA